MLRAAASDRGEKAGGYANADKYCAAEAGFHACETAIMTLDGIAMPGYTAPGAFFRDIQIARIAPVSLQLILSHIAEQVLGCRSRIDCQVAWASCQARNGERGRYRNTLNRRRVGSFV